MIAANTTSLFILLSVHTWRGFSAQNKTLPWMLFVKGKNKTTRFHGDRPLIQAHLLYVTSLLSCMDATFFTLPLNIDYFVLPKHFIFHQEHQNTEHTHSYVRQLYILVCLHIETTSNETLLIISALVKGYFLFFVLMFTSLIILPFC